MYQFSQYVCEQTGLKLPQYPELVLRLCLGREQGDSFVMAFNPGSFSPAWHPRHRMLLSWPVRRLGRPGLPFTSPSPLLSPAPSPSKV